jgi:hypothetical protein
MNHPYVFYATMPLSAMVFGFGLSATFRPDAHLTFLGFPAHTEPTAKKLNSAMMSIWGIRNITIGLLLFLITAQKDENLMAKATAVLVPLPVVDGLVSRRLIGGGELQHWLFPPILAIIAALLSS